MNTYRPDLSADASYQRHRVPPPDLSNPCWVKRVKGQTIRRNDWLRSYSTRGEWADGCTGQSVDCNSLLSEVYYWVPINEGLTNQYQITALDAGKKEYSVTVTAEDWIDLALIIAEKHPTTFAVRREPRIPSAT